MTANNFTVETEIEVHCDDCKSDLEIEYTYDHIARQWRLYVKPCQDCIDSALEQVADKATQMLCETEARVEQAIADAEAVQVMTDDDQRLERIRNGTAGPADLGIALSKGQISEAEAMNKAQAALRHAEESVA